MPRRFKLILRITGLILIALAAVLFIVGVVRTMQTEEHATADGGFVIQHRIEISRETSAIALAGAVLFGLSFIRTRKVT